MTVRKRVMHRNKGFYIKGNRIVLNSLISKVAFFGILFLFGVVTVLGVMDVLQGFDDRGDVKSGEENVFLSGEENLVTLEGTSEIIHYDYFDEGRSETFYYLRTNDGARHKLNFVSGQEPDLISGKNIQVNGTIESTTASGNGEINIENLEILQSATAGAQPNPNLGAQRTAVILVNTQENPVEYFTKEEVRKRVFDGYYDRNNDGIFDSINAFIKEVSYDKTSLTGEVYGWYTISQDICLNSFDLIRAVILRSDRDIYFPAYDRVLIIGCYNIPNSSLAGWGEVGKRSYMTPDGEAVLTFSLLATLGFEGIGNHEIGHNFGVLHANYWNCGDSQILGGCSSVEYGDRFDQMGYGSGHYNAFHKEKIGWFESNQVRKTTSPGIYSIGPIEINDDKIKALKIPTQSGYNYWIDFRRPLGQDILDYNDVYNRYHFFPYDGAFIYTDKFVSTNRGGGDTHLIDGRPLVNYEGRDISSGVAFKIGEIFYDPFNNIKIRVKNLTDQSLEIQIFGCGDGILEIGAGGEQCDDGNNINADGCDSLCRTEECGNGILQAREQCDDGNQNNNDLCKNDCELNICGDGFVGLNEQCITWQTCGFGHRNNGDGTCTVEINDIIEDGQISTTNGINFIRNNTGASIGVHSLSAPTKIGYIEWNISSILGGSIINDVSFNYTGAGTYNDRNEEIVGLRGPNLRPSTTSNDIISNYLRGVGLNIYATGGGNFIILGQNKFYLNNQAKDDLQSDSNNNIGWFAIGMRGMTSTGRIPEISSKEGSYPPKLIVTYTPPCSSYSINTGEQCDDGNTNNNDACTTKCLNNICGDGYLNIGVEQCDGSIPRGTSCQSIGFISGTLGCVPPGRLSSCKFDTAKCSLCGNRVINKDKGETCDDGNLRSGDGCSSNCRREGGGAPGGKLQKSIDSGQTLTA